MGKNGPRLASFRVVAILPNGNQHAFKTYESYIGADGNVCAEVAIGKWFGAYHVELAPPLFCP